MIYCSEPPGGARTCHDTFLEILDEEKDKWDVCTDVLGYQRWLGQVRRSFHAIRAAGIGQNQPRREVFWLCDWHTCSAGWWRVDTP